MIIFLFFPKVMEQTVLESLLVETMQIVAWESPTMQKLQVRTKFWRYLKQLLCIMFGFKTVDYHPEEILKYLYSS